MHEGGGRWVGSNKVVELKKKNKDNEVLVGPLRYSLDSSRTIQIYFYASLVAQVVKNPSTRQEDLGSITGLGRSPEKGNGYPLRYSCLENSMDREAWWAIAQVVTKSQTQLSD